MNRVKHAVAQWQREMPELDLLPMEVVGYLKTTQLLTQERLQLFFKSHGLQAGEFPALEAWLDAHAPGSELARAWAPFTHVFSHFRLEITPRPARIARLDSIGESRRWYDPARPDALGLAAPVKRLLASLAPFTLEAPPSPRESVSEESP